MYWLCFSTYEYVIRASPTLLSILSLHVEISATLYLFEELYFPALLSILSLLYLNILSLFYFFLIFLFLSLIFLHSRVKIGTKPSAKSSEDWRKKQTSSKWMLISMVSSTHQHAKNVQTTAPPPRRDRLNPHPDRCQDRQPKPRRAHPSPDWRLFVNPSHTVFYLSYFFLSCYGE